MTANTQWGTMGGKRFDADFFRKDKPTTEEMSPQDVKQRREQRVRRLRNDITRYKKYIAEAEAEIKAWVDL